MLVTIESTIGGNVAGYLQCTVTGNETISSLLSTYCESKVNLFVLYQILLFDLLHFIHRESKSIPTFYFGTRKELSLTIRRLCQEVILNMEIPFILKLEVLILFENE
jgi:hypothetical protein